MDYTRKQIEILNVAQYIIENKATIEQTAIHFRKSISTIKKYINDEQNLQSLDVELYKKLKEIQSEIIAIGNKKGGSKGVRKSSYSDELIIHIAKMMISNEMTLSQAAIQFKIPVSTLYDLLNKIENKEIKDKLRVLFELNILKKNALLNDERRLSNR